MKIQEQSALEASTRDQIDISTSASGGHPTVVVSVLCSGRRTVIEMAPHEARDLGCGLVVVGVQGIQIQAHLNQNGSTQGLVAIDGGRA